MLVTVQTGLCIFNSHLYEILLEGNFKEAVVKPLEIRFVYAQFRGVFLDAVPFGDGIFEFQPQPPAIISMAVPPHKKIG